MICYKDKTWCTFSECKNSKTCKSFLTENAKQAAAKWWGKKEEAPIMKYATKPDCYEEDS